MQYIQSTKLATLMILALDTSTQYCSIAIEVDNNVFERCLSTPKMHTQAILGMIDELIKNTNQSLSDLELIVVGQGPGSFTGVRVAISVASALAYGLKCKVLPVSSLKALAYSEVVSSKRVCAIMDARMNEVYWGLYQNGESIIDDQLSNCETLLQKIEPYRNEMQVVSYNLAEFSSLQSAFEGNYKENHPDAKALLKLAKGAPVSMHQDALELRPVYLRNDIIQNR